MINTTPFTILSLPPIHNNTSSPGAGSPNNTFPLFPNLSSIPTTTPPSPSPLSPPPLTRSSSDLSSPTGEDDDGLIRSSDVFPRPESLDRRTIVADRLSFNPDGNGSSYLSTMNINNHSSRYTLHVPSPHVSRLKPAHMTAYSTVQCSTNFPARQETFAEVVVIRMQSPPPPLTGTYKKSGVTKEETK